MWHRILQGRRSRIWALLGLIALGITGCGGDSGGNVIGMIPTVYTSTDGSALPQMAKIGRYLVTVAARSVPGAPSTTSANYNGNISGPSSITLQGKYYKFFISLGDARPGPRNINFGPHQRLLQALTFESDNSMEIPVHPQTGCGVPIFYTLSDSNGNILQQQAGVYLLNGGQTYTVLAEFASSVSAGSTVSSRSASSTTLPLTFSAITQQNGGDTFTVTVPSVTSSTQSSFTMGGDQCYPPTGVSMVANP